MKGPTPENAEKRERLLKAAVAVLRAAPDRRLLTVQLNKALFYFDLVHLRDEGETFTQNAYIALPQGPVVAKYDQRLIGALVKEGIAEQLSSSMGGGVIAKPVVLRRDPGYTLPGPALKFATRAGSWAAKFKAGTLSDLSHENPGWIIARKKGEELGRPQPVNMLIALQQVADEDPWVSEDDKGFRAAMRDADDAETEAW